MQNLLQANCLEFIETLQICTCWTITSGAPYWKSKMMPQPKSNKTTDELKVALQTIWEELPQEHQQGGGELHQALDCQHGCGCNRGYAQHLQ